MFRKWNISVICPAYYLVSKCSYGGTEGRKGQHRKKKINLMDMKIATKVA